MTKTTCIVLDRSDFTRDNNIKAETFEAIIAADVVVHGTRVVKNNFQAAEPAVTQDLRPALLAANRAFEGASNEEG